MLRKITQTLGLPPSVRHRIAFLWGLNFLYQIGFILAWIVITSLFLEAFGVEKLLWLFGAEACLLLMGSLITREFWSRVPLNTILFWAVGLMIGTISLAGYLFFQGELLWFFLLALAAKDLMYPRLRIGILRKTEEIFSPSEAEEAMPRIDSAITIGTVVSAGLLLWLLTAFSLPQLLLFWLVPLGIILTLLIAENRLLNDIPEIKDAEKKEASKPFYNVAKLAHRIPFLKFLSIVVFLQAMLFSITEFEFMHTLGGHFDLPHSTEASHAFQFPDQTHFQVSLFDQAVEAGKQLGINAMDKWETVSSHVIAHQTLAHDLGVLSLIFGLATLLVQFFLTSRILKKFGIVRTMMGYFLGFFLAASLLIFRGGAINFIRGYEHGFHSLFLSGYHITFYSAFKQYREFLRVFLEGILTPLAILFSVAVMALLLSLGLQAIFPYLMALIAVILVGTTYAMRRSFTAVSTENFHTAPTLAEKLLATEMLGHAGHVGATEVLAAALVDKNQHRVIREKIIHTLTEKNDPRAVHTYISLLKQNAEDTEMKIQILDSLLRIKSLPDYCSKRAFTQHQMLEVLRQQFEVTAHDHLRKLLVMNILHHLPLSKTVSFLQETLEGADEKLQSICLRSCQMFDDPEIVNYLKPYLEHQSPRIRSHCVIALWKVGEKRTLWQILQPLMESNTPEDLIAGMYAAGEVQYAPALEWIKKYRQHEHSDVRLHALIALGKMGEKSIVSELLKLMLGPDVALAKRAYEMSKRFPEDLREKLHRAIQRAVAQRVFAVLNEENISSREHLRKLSPEKLAFLKRLYLLGGKYDHVSAIEGLGN
ncbi:MAG: HEAT repeat domain-containing protein [Candidatus Gracilibacteria bacterium]|nr:HEAT repeat domain-containing protein [Candidatus Gracilibacteria bacterium]